MRRCSTFLSCHYIGYKCRGNSPGIGPGNEARKWMVGLLEMICYARICSFMPSEGRVHVLICLSSHLCVSAAQILSVLSSVVLSHISSSRVAHRPLWHLEAVGFSFLPPENRAKDRKPWEAVSWCQGSVSYRSGCFGLCEPWPASALDPK